MWKANGDPINVCELLWVNPNELAASKLYDSREKEFLKRSRVTWGLQILLAVITS